MLLICRYEMFFKHNTPPQVVKEDTRNKEKRSKRHDMSSPETDHMISKAIRYNIYITKINHHKHNIINITYNSNSKKQENLMPVWSCRPRSKIHLAFAYSRTWFWSQTLVGGLIDCDSNFKFCQRASRSG